MQEYKFKHKYNGIFLRWSIGYLHIEKEVVDFLKKAKQALVSNERRSTRLSKPSSFIYVVDNVIEPWEEEHCDKGEM